MKTIRIFQSKAVLFPILIFVWIFASSMNTAHDSMNDNTPKNSETVHKDVFRNYNKLIAILPDFDFDATCNIISFEMIRIADREDPVVIKNKGANFQKMTKDLIKHAKRGDKFVFYNIRSMCPGDNHSRPVAPINIIIK